MSLAPRLRVRVRLRPRRSWDDEDGCDCGPLGDPLDDETGEHHAAHAAARALLACGLYYGKKP